MGLQYRILLASAAFVAIAAAYSVIFSNINRTPEATFPHEIIKTEVTIGGGPSGNERTINGKPYTGPTPVPYTTLEPPSGNFQITIGGSISYPISYDPPLAINNECLYKDVDDLQDKIGIDNVTIYTILTDDRLDGFHVIPKKYGEEIEDDLTKIIENCKE